MSRPMYETFEQLQDEAQLITRVCERWRCEAAKLPIKYYVDYVLHRDGIPQAWCEIKIRKYSFAELDKMGGYMMSLNKWHMADGLVRLTGLPFILVVQCKDEARAVTYSGNLPRFRVQLGGRPVTDRGDWQDWEPCVFIPISEFLRVIP